MTNKTITAKGFDIRTTLGADNSDYISLTDIAKYRNGTFPADVVKKLDAKPQHYRISWSMGATK